MQTRYSFALILARGYAAPEVRAALARALAVARAAGRTSALFPILFGQFAAHFVRAEWRIAELLASQILELAHGSSESAVRLSADLSAGCLHLSRGRLSEAHALLEAAANAYDAEAHAPLARTLGQDLGAAAHAYLALACWGLGWYDQAREASLASVALARRAEHPHSLGLALSLRLFFLFLLREPHAAEAVAAEIALLSEDHQFLHWRGDALIGQAWLAALAGRADESVALLENGMALFESGGVDTSLPYHQPEQVEIYRLAGRTETALTSAAGAADALLARGETWWVLPELFRLRGLLLAETGAPPEQAHAWMQRAQEAAAAGGHHSFELRALCTLLGAGAPDPDRNRARLRALIARRGATGCTADLEEARLHAARG